MPLTEIVQLDIIRAQQQIDRLEQQLRGLGSPINVPVNVTGEGDVSRVRQELGSADNAAEDLNRELNQTEAALRDVGQDAKRTGDDLQTAGRKGTKSFGDLKTSVLGFAAAFGLIRGARAFFNFASESIQAASDLEESLSKSSVVFGEFADEIERFADTGPSALGLSNAAALEFTATFGNLFVALGLSQQAAADLSPEIVQLGADLASFNNIEVDEALTALRSGLVGEAEPLRRLGVNINAAVVEAKALELGLVGVSGEVTEAAKVQARYALILEQTGTAQGDFARTADGIANRQRTLNAEIEKSRAAFGEALLPAFESLLEATPAIIEALEGLIPAFEGVVEMIADTDFEGAISSWLRFGRTVSGVGQLLLEMDFGGATTQGFINDWVASVEAGVEPTKAFAAVLEQFQGFRFDVAQDLDAGQVTELVDELQRAADLDPEQLLVLLRYFQEFGPAMDLTEAELQGIIEGLQLTVRGAEAVPPALDELVDGISNVGDASIGAGPPLADLGGVAEATAEQMAEAAELIDGVFEGVDLGDPTTSFADLVSKLPSALDGAAAAMRDKEDEIRTDFSGFLDDLEGELATRQSFSEDIAALRSLGLDDLADSFVDQGLEAAALLADAVANPEEAQRAEDLLDQYAVEQAGSFRQTIADELQQALDLTVPLNVQAVIQALNIRGLDDFANQVSDGNRLRNVNETSTGSQVTVNNNYYTEPVPTPTTARVSQQNAALVNVE